MTVEEMQKQIESMMPTPKQIVEKIDKKLEEDTNNKTPEEISKKYILVQWPESQELMEHPRFSECLFVQDIEGHEEVGSSAYMCPEDLYEEIYAPTEEDFNLYEAMKNMPKDEFLQMIENIVKEK